MNIDLQPKKVSALLPTDIPFQTAYWSEVKSRLGWQPAAFDYRSSTGQAGDVLLLTRTLDSGPGVAYVPQGPEAGPEPEQQGLFLEALSLALAKHLDSSVAFVRYDLPWTSPYASDAPKGEPWPGHPAVPLRELRMNFGTRTWNLRKAALDLTVADALVIDLRPPVEKIFAGMKSKTRYNIRLARKGASRSFARPSTSCRFFTICIFRRQNGTALRPAPTAPLPRCFPPAHPAADHLKPFFFWPPEARISSPAESSLLRDARPCICTAPPPASGGI